MPKKKKKLTPKPIPFTQLREHVNQQWLPIFSKGGREYATPNGLPGSVKILGMDYKVKYHSKIYTTNKEMLRGIVMFQHRLIFIEPTQTLQLMRETLYHEMAHVYYATWCVGNPLLRKLTGAQVEDLCDMFADSACDLVSNNQPT